MSGASVFGGVLSRGAAAGEVDGAAWTRALLDVEAALARAAAEVGLADPVAAAAVSAACADLAPGGAAEVDPADLGRAAAASGNPVVPLVPRISERAGAAGAGAVHVGATSQDVIDTAVVLLARRAGAAVLADTAATADALADLARTHRDTPMTGRTLLQQALPTTFGLRAATWAAGLDRAAAGLAGAVAALPVQHGGAVGTLAGLDRPDGTSAALALRAALARQLDLPVPALAWHTDRTPVGALAGALGVLAGAVATTALDLVLLAQTEVGEVREDARDESGRPRGGSSAMPHKRNPVAAVSARAGALRAPGLVATLLSAMAGEHERAAGAWHSEWEALSDLLRTCGSAAAWLRDAVEHLVVDTAALRAHADEAADAASSAALAAALAGPLGRSGAHALVAEAAGRARESGVPLREAVRSLLAERGEQADHLPGPVLDVGAAGELVDAWLAARGAPEQHDPPAPSPTPRGARP